MHHARDRHWLIGSLFASSVLAAGCGATHSSDDDAGVAIDARGVVAIDVYVPPGVDADLHIDAAIVEDDVFVPEGVDGAIPARPDAASGTPDARSAGPVAIVGTPCTTDAECPGLFCSPLGTGLGYCSWVCSDAMPCPGESVCVEFDPSASYGYCLAPCTEGGEACAPGNRCQTGLAEVDVCYPGCTTDSDCDAGQQCGTGISGIDTCYSPVGETGQPCLDAGECPELGYCLDEPTWGTPGGLCTTFCDLASGSGCEIGTTCVAWGFMSGAGACIPTCDDMRPCRDGYDCVSTGSGRPRACVARCSDDAVCTGDRECNFVTGRCG
ncbi:MAG: hypothetical protein J0L92_27180 [Deltaproteobacteria bacterium]|nr:hypothetical protein [Deltaproteobacteria bacterium]